MAQYLTSIRAGTWSSLVEWGQRLVHHHNCITNLVVVHHELSLFLAFHKIPMLKNS